MDTIIGKDGKGANLTHKERSTPLLLMTKFKKGKNAEEVTKEELRLQLPFKDKMLKNNPKFNYKVVKVVVIRRMTLTRQQRTYRRGGTEKKSIVAVPK